MGNPMDPKDLHVGDKVAISGFGSFASGKIERVPQSGAKKFMISDPKTKKVEQVDAEQIVRKLD
ncbi:hypothetical protein ABZ883_03040 [Streptomyces sp. NPDC046977]|uniref:hypothetical protein n=1 Tax=Streptomyces sp. NPDC046977 TaxID=3154703 RepID=UPI0033F6B7EA